MRCLLSWYFVPWVTKNLKQDTQFYINDKDQVVVFFNKYELGAGAMGTPEFIIDVSK